ncbi:hypothetical protein P43SY_002842 [Pythium insidiosum]|uniref:Uncharacterized protein n=1 Tax=Pythium insidiosum TaxID=114742 RepID=A0AAD5LQ76_PYTIN|nr:hypothetical protein P43SY_002842 [Pythium insidiosum]
MTPARGRRRDDSDAASSQSQSPSKLRRVTCSGADSALRVLTDADLFRGVVEFLPGLPQGIVRFQREFMVSPREKSRVAARIDKVMGHIHVPPLSDEAELLLVAPQHGLLRPWSEHDPPLDADDEDEEEDDEYSALRLNTSPNIFPRVARWVRDYDDVDDERHNTAKLVALLRRLEDARRSPMEAAIIENQLRVLEQMYWLHHHPTDVMNPRMTFRSPMRVAARHARGDVLQWLALKPEREQWLRDEWLLDAALRSGDLSTIEWVYRESVLAFQLRPRIKCVTMNRAAAVGDLHVIQWVDAHDKLTYDFTELALDAAACNGHLEVVRYITEHHSDVVCTTVAMDLAARNGHFEVVKYLHTSRKEGCTHCAMDLAAKGGYLSIVQYLHYHRQEGCSTQAMDFAARGGHIDVVEFLHQHRSEGCSSNAMDFAAARGHVKTVQFLHEERSEGASTNAMDGAAIGGHLEVVRFLHTQRQEGCTVLAMNGAASPLNGHIEMVQFLVREGFKWNHDAIDGAATNGHFAVVRWLLKVDPEEYDNECATEDEDSVWEEDDQDEFFTEAAMDGAIGNGHWTIVQLLLRNLGEWTSFGLDVAAGNGHFDVVRQLLEDRYVSEASVSMRGYLMAAAAGDVEMVKLLRQFYGVARPDYYAMEMAIDANDLTMVKFLHKVFQRPFDPWLVEALDPEVTLGKYVRSHLSTFD